MIDPVLLTFLGTFAVAVAVVLVASIRSVRSIRRGLGPDRGAIRINVMVAGLWIFLSAFYGMALIYFAGLGQAAVVALPFVGIGLFLIRKAWTYR